MKFNLINKIITYVKDERGNLSTLVATLTIVVDCVPLQIDTPYLRTCFKHVMSKAWQYATNHDHVCLGTKEVNLKGVQFSFKNIITWTKKSKNGLLEWQNAWVEVYLLKNKLKTLIKTKFSFKVLFFKETLAYPNIINICNSQQTRTLQARVPSCQTWVVVATICECFTPLVHQWIMN